MVTRVNPVAGRYFNDPAFAAGVSNLAAAFAPPSAEDYLAAEKYKGLQTQNSALNDLYTQADGDADLLGVIADLYDPTSGWEAMRGKLDNDRYATDRSYDASILNNAADNEAVLRGRAFDARVNPDGRQAISDEEMFGAMGLDIGGFAAAQPVAPTDAQVKGGLLAGLTPDEQRAILGSDVDTNLVDTPTGPVYRTPLDSLGQPAYVNPGSQPTPTGLTYTGADGVRRGALFQNGQFVDTTGRALTPEEAGTVAEIGKPVGTNKDLGINTTSNVTDATRIEATATEVDLIVSDIESLVASRPGAAGLAGSFQRLGQDFVQSAREFSAMLDEQGVDGIVTPEMLDGLEARLDAPKPGEQSQPYDPVFQQVSTYMLRLAYANAAINNGGNEVSQSALARELEALGQGLLGNDQSLLAALSVSKQNARIAREKAKVLRGGQAGVIPTIADVNAGGASSPGGIPEGVTPEEWGVMTPEERAVFQ